MGKEIDLLINYLEKQDPKLTHGPKVIEFESEWSKWLGVKHSVMFNSGASANDITMLALAEIDGKGEVIVPPLTWVSDIASVIHAGHDPIFVDINPSTLAMDENKIVEAINYASDSYWGDPQRFQFRAMIDSFTMKTELADKAERTVSSTFNIKIWGCN